MGPSESALVVSRVLSNPPEVRPDLILGLSKHDGRQALSDGPSLFSQGRHQLANAHWDVHAARTFVPVSPIEPDRILA